MPETFVDYAEEVWGMIASGKTQQQVADELSWSRGKVSQYAMLKDISKEAWEVVATSFLKSVATTGIYTGFGI